MVKSKEAAMRKMEDRVATAGTYLKEALAEAEDPIDVALKDVNAHTSKMTAGLQEAVRVGKVEEGLKKAKARGSWEKSHDRAAAHYEERASDMVEHAMEGYDERRECIEKSKKAIEKMPKATRAQRIARSSKYQEEMGKCMDAKKGRK
jgi:hypothetical protein